MRFGPSPVNLQSSNCRIKRKTSRCGPRLVVRPRAQCYDARMRGDFRCVGLAAVLFFAAGASAAAQEDSTELVRQGTVLSQKGNYAGAAEAFEGALTSAPGSSEPWMRWADFGLERFRVLQLELRSTQRGMATVLRLEAGGLRSSGPETRAELLRQSAT